MASLRDEGCVDTVEAFVGSVPGPVRARAIEVATIWAQEGGKIMACHADRLLGAVGVVVGGDGWAP